MNVLFYAIVIAYFKSNQANCDNELSVHANYYYNNSNYIIIIIIIIVIIIIINKYVSVHSTVIIPCSLPISSLCGLRTISQSAH